MFFCLRDNLFGVMVFVKQKFRKNYGKNANLLDFLG